MSDPAKARPDPWFLVSRLLPVTDKEARHLGITADRLRARQPDREWARSLEADIEAAEMLDAFVSRFSRLQDTPAESGSDPVFPSLMARFDVYRNP